MRQFIVAVDFDGTIVAHEYPEIGDPSPGAIAWMNIWQQAGAGIILHTMRCDQRLAEAVAYVAEQLDQPLFGVNSNVTQRLWTTSPKVYAHAYVDVAAVGCPYRGPALANVRPLADWRIIGPMVFSQITGRKAPRAWADMAEKGIPISSDLVESALIGLEDRE